MEEQRRGSGESSEPDNRGLQTRVAEYAVVEPNLDVLKSQ
jgi:hypothetical protein